MPSDFQDLLKTLTGDQVDALSNSLGADRSQTQSAIAAALPMLLQGLARNASTPEGASALHGALEKDHDGSILDGLGDFLSAPDTDDGNKILGHVLGGRQKAVETGVAQASGLDMSKVAPLLATLAPVLLGMLGRKQRAGGLDSGALANMLGDERGAMERAAPQLGGFAAIFDQDGDGQVMDDLASKFGKQLLGNLLGKR